MNSDNRDRNFVNENQISKYLKCTLCLQVFVSPSRLKCGYYDLIEDSHTFCKNCILDWLKIKLMCPLCKQNTTIKSLSADLVAAGIVSELPVYCSNKGFGCKWNGVKDRLEVHEKKCTVKEVAETLKLQLSETKNNQEDSDEQGNSNDPGNLWQRVNAKIEDKKQLQSVLELSQDNKDQDVDDDDPLNFLASMERYLGDHDSIQRRLDEVVNNELPKQSRERISQSQ